MSETVRSALENASVPATGPLHLPNARKLAGVNVAGFPLSFYRRTPLVNMKVSALDRFGTDLEQRFTRAEIAAMMARCGLTDIRFQEQEPYWVSIGRRA